MSKISSRGTVILSMLSYISVLILVTIDYPFMSVGYIVKSVLALLILSASFLILIKNKSNK